MSLFSRNSAPLKKNEKSEAEKLSELISDAQAAVWGKREIKEALQKNGVNIIPCNFYSSIPSIEEIEQSYEYNGEPPYLNTDIFKADFMRKWLESLIPYAEDFNPPLEGNEETCDSYFWKNSQFSYADAMSYYAFVRKLKPGKIVEIGSGFSTLVASAAIKANGSGSITCIEPYPRPFLPKIEGVSLLPTKAQDITPQQLNDMLDDGDILFIDSTHTVKTGSDCAHIYLRLLPHIRKHIYVHIHDIFLPFGLPKQWLLDSQIHWTEQYLVMAWLLDNPKTNVLYGSTYHSHFNLDLATQLMWNRYPTKGASLWIEYNNR